VIEAMREQLDMRYRWLERTIERMEERKQRGDSTVEMQTGELQHVFQELLSMHLRCDRLENMLAEFAGVYQRPSLIVPKELL
jgi:hypothetical protein